MNKRINELNRAIRFVSLAIVVITIGIVLAACAPDSGRVAEAEYHPARSYWVAGTSGYCSGSGSSRVCTPGTPGHMQFDPESWSLRLINGDEDGWMSVDETTFRKCRPPEAHYPECAQ